MAPDPARKGEPNRREEMRDRAELVVAGEGAIAGVDFLRIAIGLLTPRQTAVKGSGAPAAKKDGRRERPAETEAEEQE